MKKFLLLAGCLFNFTCFAACQNNEFALSPNCPVADKTSPTFCSVFVEAAQCHCREMFPQGFCNGKSMRNFYDMMTASGRKSLETGCREQEATTHVPYALCVDHWSHYKSHCSF